MTDPRPNGFRAATRERYFAARDELRRPLPLALAAAAVIGWIAVVSLAWSASAQRAELARTEAVRTELAGELDRQRQASVQLADLQAKISRAEGELARLNQSIGQAQTQVAARRKSSGRRGRGQ
jgi:TolA-binding protein